MATEPHPGGGSGDGGVGRTSDRGDELLQSPEQVGVPLEVVEVMLHPVAAHVQDSAGTTRRHLK